MSTLRMTGVMATTVALVATAGTSAVAADGKETGSTPADPAPELIVRAPQLPAMIPEGLRSGKLKTPLGPATWIQYSGTVDKLPAEFFELTPVPGGWVLADGPSGRLWFTDDLIDWSTWPLPFPERGTSISAADGHYWLMVDVDEPDLGDPWASAHLWHSRNTIDWEPVDLGALVPPSTGHFEWDIAIHGFAASGARAIGMVEYALRDPARILGSGSQHAEWASLQRLDADRYRVRDANGIDLGTIRFEAMLGGVRVVDEADGAVLAEIPGIDPAFIDRWAASGQAGDRSWVLFGPDGSRELRPPTETDDPDYWIADDLLMTTFVSPDGLPEVWRSADGATWEQAFVVGDDPGEPRRPAELHFWDGQFVASSWRSGSEQRWVSDDGATWQKVAVDREPGYPSARAGDTWLALSGFDDDGYHRSLRFLRDNGKAKRVGVRRLRIDGEFEPGMHRVGPGVLAVHGLFPRGAKPDKRVIWIIQFDDLVSQQDLASGR